VWGLLADELVVTHFDPYAMAIDYPQPKLWTALATLLVLQITKLYTERRETGDLGWVWCTACPFTASTRPKGCSAPLLR
jgi:hypothetical protein